MTKGDFVVLKPTLFSFYSELVEVLGGGPGEMEPLLNSDRALDPRTDSRTSIKLIPWRAACLQVFAPHLYLID